MDLMILVTLTAAIALLFALFTAKKLAKSDAGTEDVQRISGIIKKAANACNISGVVSCHSLRKTFGYHAWKQGISPVLLMNIYNHSSFVVTQRYLGIEQDDRDNVFKTITI